MKKIAVGAFPLVSIDKIERKMVENYLINTLSDLINVNQLSADINSDRARFITPMSILNFIKENKDASQNLPAVKAIIVLGSGVENGQPSAILATFLPTFP